MGKSAVSQQQVNQISDQLLSNASIRQARLGSTSINFNMGFGWVGLKGIEDPIMMLASIPKVIILKELADALMATGQSTVRLTTEMRDEVIQRRPQRIAERQDIYKLGGIMPMSELFYQVATLSSESATRMVKQIRGDAIGNASLQQAYQILAPTYVMLETMEDNHHWGEYRPNTGLISEVANQLDTLIRRVQSGTATEMEVILAESLLNNPQDFSFCFTHSELGKLLIKLGYKIYEKTGYYPAVTWVKGLADMGYPTVLVMATVCTIVAPDGAISTFYQYSNDEVPYPWELIKENGVKFPNEWGLGYKQYIAIHKPKLDVGFRVRMDTVVRPFLQL